ncbi:hypothetical protein BaRGS_00038158 [Batillaria attramentaria]|uniref:Uncharacterized protein n=1 Tax=Batillaria attramentaria TaxID=370345 RepID=A0ABD0J721_9CAEN
MGRWPEVQVLKRRSDKKNTDLVYVLSAVSLLGSWLCFLTTDIFSPTRNNGTACCGSSTLLPRQCYSQSTTLVHYPGRGSGNSVVL